MIKKELGIFFTAGNKRIDAWAHIQASLKGIECTKGPRSP